MLWCGSRDSGVFVGEVKQFSPPAENEKSQLVTTGSLLRNSDNELALFTEP
jgi:hypothetical protein